MKTHGQRQQPVLAGCAVHARGWSIIALAWLIGPTPAMSIYAAPEFEYVDSYASPGGVWDILDDGRIIAAAGNDIVIESEVNSGRYDVAGRMPDGLIAPWGASFAELSPDHQWLLVGDNNFGDAFVYLIDVAELDGGDINPTAIAQENYEAAWFDNRHVAVSYANPQTFLGEVAILDIETEISNPVVAIDGASAGVAFDPGGYLLTGNGYDMAPGGSNAGDIRAFSLRSIENVVQGNAEVIDFAQSGTFITNALSASSLRTDLRGHLFVGGGRSDEADFFMIADTSAVARALMDGGPIDPTTIFTTDPADMPDSMYRARFNVTTGEWIVDGVDGFLYRYRELTCLTLSVNHLIGGQVSTFVIANGSPGARAVLVFGFASDRSLLADIDGYCATFGIRGIDRGRAVGRREYVFDSDGFLAVRHFVPKRMAGRRIFLQAAEKGQCPDECMSNVLRRAIE